MAFAFFQIPMDAGPEVAVALNKFLKTHQVLRTTREWCEAGQESCWAFCLEYMEKDQSRREGTARIYFARDSLLIFIDNWNELQSRFSPNFQLMDKTSFLAA